MEGNWGEREKTLVSGLILEVNWEEGPPRGRPLNLPFNIPFSTEKVPFLCTASIENWFLLHTFFLSLRASKSELEGQS